MKRILVAACLGITVSASAPCFGQAVIFFNNYGSYPVQYSTDPAMVPPGMAGQLADSTFRVDLLYGFGVISDPALLVDAGLSVFINPATPGYFDGGMVSLPAYTSGPVTFMVEAWETTGPYGGDTFANSSLRGATPLFTESTLVSGPLDLPGPLYVALVPEPSVHALLSLASLILIRWPPRRTALPRASESSRHRTGAASESLAVL